MSWTLKIFYIKDAFKPEELVCSEHGIWKRGTIEKKLTKKERQHKIFQQQTSTQAHDYQVTIHKEIEEYTANTC